MANTVKVLIFKKVDSKGSTRKIVQILGSNAFLNIQNFWTFVFAQIKDLMALSVLILVKFKKKLLNRP